MSAWAAWPYLFAAVVVWPARWAVLLVVDGWRLKQAEKRNGLRALGSAVERAGRLQ